MYRVKKENIIGVVEMGMFDTFVGWSNCNHCGRLNHANIQFKWLDSIMADYGVGSYVSGHKPFEIFDEDEMACDMCQKSYSVYALGKEGYLLGFVNESQLETLKTYINFEEEEDFVTFSISKNLLNEDMGYVMQEIQKEYHRQPYKDKHTISSNQVDDDIIEQNVCQIPDFVHDPYKRPNVGDVCYEYKKDRTKFFDKNKAGNERLIIIQREMNEESHSYIYRVQKENGEIIDYLHEAYLINEEQKVGIEESIARTKETIIKYWKLKTKERTKKEEQSLLLIKLMTRSVEPELIEEMKKSGDIPTHFSFD